MAAFTVKATYRNETRKFSFADPTFPTYDQLYSQLYRVFPLSHSFYLSKLLFTHHNTPTRVLVGKEVHSAEEYARHVAPYLGRSWPGALLRFSVYDETPHKSPRMVPSLGLVDFAPSGSSDARASVATASESASIHSTATVVEPAADVLSTLRGERRVLLDRIRESTNNRSSVTSQAIPPTPPRSSRPTSMADSYSRPTSLVEDPSALRPLPARPSSRDASTMSTASTRTVRPSLFDLLGNTLPSTSAPEVGSEQSKGRTGVSDRKRPRPVSDMHWDKWVGQWTKTVPFSPSPVDLSPLRSNKPTPAQLPSIDDLSLPRMSSFVAPPPPILYPAMRPLRKVEDDGDVVMSTRSPLRTRPSVTAQLPAQQAHPPQPSYLSAQLRPRPEVQSTSKEVLPQERRTSLCCSLAEGKAEIKALMDQFKRDFEEKMTKTFGKDWEKESLRTDEQLPNLPSPPTHRPVPPSCTLPSRLPRSTSWPPPPPPPHFVPLPPPPPPPAPPLYMPPPPPPCLPPPPPPCIIPPPPMPVPFALGGGLPGPRWASNPPPAPHIGFDPSRLAQESKGASHSEKQTRTEHVHKGVKCDHCDKRNIKGTRFKCLECTDYDLCETCIASPSAWKAHNRTHAFFPIHTTENFIEFCVVKDKREESRPVHSGVTCDGCGNRPFSGVRHKCLQCEDFDFCDACICNSHVRQKHNASHCFFPIVTPGKKDAYDEVRSCLQPVSKTPPPGTIRHDSVYCDECHECPIVGVRHRCLDCSDYDLCTSCISNPLRRAQHDASHAFFPVTVPSDFTGFHLALARHNRPLFGHGAQQSFAQDNAFHELPSAPEPAPLVHKNILCDICNTEIVGVRHKCLDCPDYDLCQTCLQTPFLRSQHHSGHQFFAIEKPGEVIVHTVFSGDGEREPEQPAQHEPPRENASRVHSRDVEPVVHNAMCNLCDSRIRGDRFKCLNCPDYDLCQLCYKIANEQHPDHGFVKVGEPAILMLRNRANDPVHHASCNVCRNRIVGVRYKCMHESCEDFDLCEICEAHPIPVHPVAHPLLKLRTPESRIPKVSDSLPHPSRSPVGNPFAPEIDFHDVVSRVPESPVEHEQYGTYAPPPPQVRPLPDISPKIQESPGMFVPQPVGEVPVMGIYRDFFGVPDARIELSRPSSVAIIEIVSHRPASPMSVQSRSPVSDCNNPFTHAAAVVELAPIAPSPPLPPFTKSPSPTPSPAPKAEEPHAEISTAPPPVWSTTRDAYAPLIEFDEPTPWREERSAPEALTGTGAAADGFTTPSEAPISSNSSTTVPKLGPVNNEWRELWPEMTSIFKHLLQPSTPPVAPSASGPTSGSGFAMPGGMTVEEIKPSTSQGAEAPTAVGSPLVGEPLLCRPLVQERPLTTLGSSRLSDLILSVPTVRSAARNVRESLDHLVPPVPARRSHPKPLQASFLSDNNITDGQIFPPGAEFVKSWRMKNSGEVDWPETTELIFVAGDRMAPHSNALNRAHIGLVKPGAEVDIVAGEMKAPEAPSKYVSSWRLTDGVNLFGDSVWVDITVAEPNESSSGSLASSSIIMPGTALQPSSTRSVNDHVFTHFSTPSATIQSGPPSDSGSSVSLIDALSSSSSDDDAIYEDSRSRMLVSPTMVPREMDYVMLFDSSSEDE
ncbi:hypothetical protein C8Q79DRAFT_1081591 [Trametes meyenii]|nr:hypothetical protein C8Q79DRAFT_1081591 [Trametes meyenii]